jgi:CheY-like chemotaxis protein
MSKVLLADDDATMVSLLTTLLRMAGFEAETLMDRPDMLAAIRAEKPDALLIDVHLGARSGLDIVHEVRRQKDLQGIKIVMASGIDRKEECLAAGANAFLLKPYMPDDLIQVLQS